MECSKPKKIIIAIDGFSSCGKSTFAKTIAAKLGYIFIDTGAIHTPFVCIETGRITQTGIGIQPHMGSICQDQFIFSPPGNFQGIVLPFFDTSVFGGRHPL